ncbi:MAG: M23 family metallopeptidase [Heteroscytonema crispum UTEX LB 1556]
MTQRNNSGDSRLPQPLQRCLTTRRLASTLPAQSLCWLSSFSILSSGFVYAQTQTGIDNIVPTVENSQPSSAGNPVKQNTVKRDRTASAPESDQARPEFSTRRARLRLRLRRRSQVASQTQQPVRKHIADSQPVVIIRRSRHQAEYSAPTVNLRRARRFAGDSTPVAAIRRSRRRVETSQKPVIIREEKPQVEVSREEKPQGQLNAPEKLPQITPPSNNSNSTVSATVKPKDYNNAYIDPTDYNTAGAGKYEAPNSVVLTQRSSGCRTILSQGQSVSGRLCAKAPLNPSRDRHLANSNNKKSAPSWLRRSQTAQIASVSAPISPVRRGENRTNSGWRATRIGPININNGGWRAARIASRSVSNTGWRQTRIATASGITKSGFHPNRFIPSPSNFIPATTRVSAFPIAPMAGALPVPMTADNFAPRPSTVAYNIPLASTLPQIAWSGGGTSYAYGGGMGMGLMFPLTIPAPITSLFGWRMHPISGDRRFHAGTDLGAPQGTPVLAANNGTVEIADYVGGYGLTVIMNHTNAQQTLYGHMSEIYVQPGQVVPQGTVIGRVGNTGNSTGPHLHFEVRQLTAQGWVATDPGVQLQSALNNLVQVLQTAQISQQPGS